MRVASAIGVIEGKKDPANEKSVLEQQLIENQTQCTEIVGQINQLTIQLHRCQLRLQTLGARQSEIKAEIAKLPPAPPAASS